MISCTALFWTWPLCQYSHLLHLHVGFTAYQTLSSLKNNVFCTKIKRPERESSHSSPTRNEFRSGWGYYFTSQYKIKQWFQVKHRGIFTFVLILKYVKFVDMYLEAKCKTILNTGQNKLLLPWIQFLLNGDFLLQHWNLLTNYLLLQLLQFCFEPNSERGCSGVLAEIQLGEKGDLISCNTSVTYGLPQHCYCLVQDKLQLKVQNVS